MTSLAKKLDSLSRTYEQLQAQVRTERKALKRARERELVALSSQKLFQTAAEAVQAKAHSQIASVVSRCLEAVFGEEAYEFKIEFEQKRGKTEARLVFLQDGHEIHPTEGSGGGCVEVAAFALRLARLMMSTPHRRRVLVCDEPFKSVHGEENRRRLAELLITLSKEMQVQMIIATGLDWLKIGKVIEVQN